LERELAEEVYVANRLSLRIIGLINDDTTEVGRVHLGLFCVADVSGEVRVLETDKLTGGWVKISGIDALDGEKESWTEIAAGSLTA